MYKIGVLNVQRCKYNLRYLKNYIIGKADNLIQIINYIIMMVNLK